MGERHGPAAIGVLAWGALLVTAPVIVQPTPAVADGRDTERAPDTSSPTRIGGVNYMREGAGGVFGVGWSRLFHLARGAKSWKLLHRAAGDGLYRVAVDPAGPRFLAWWEKEPSFHVFDPSTGADVLLPKPTAPPGIEQFYLDSLAFSLDGRDALVFFTGGRREPRHYAEMVYGYRVPLDGSGGPVEAFAGADRKVLATGPYGALCTSTPYHTGVFAYEVGAKSTAPRTLAPESVKAGEQVMTSDPSRVVLSLPGELLEYRNSDGHVEHHKTATVSSLFALVTDQPDELIRLAGDGIALKLTVESLGGAVRRTVLLPSRHSWKTSAAFAGRRRNGTIWVYWGDQMLFVKDDGTIKGADVRGMTGAFSSPGAVLQPVAESDSLWMQAPSLRGPPVLELVQVRFDDLERRAKPWGPTPKTCSDLPSVKDMMQWTAVEQRCRSNDDRPSRPAPVPTAIKKLPDGTIIIDGGADGCMRVNPVCERQYRK